MCDQGNTARRAGILDGNVDLADWPVDQQLFRLQSHRSRFLLGM
jgi:lysozyme family protein